MPKGEELFHLSRSALARIVEDELGIPVKASYNKQRLLGFILQSKHLDAIIAGYKRNTLEDWANIILRRDK
jgi:hypothetical protein